MTILTKSTDKKPLVENAASAPPLPIVDAERLLVQTRQKRMSSATTILILIASLGVLSLGIISGIAIFRAYSRVQSHRMRFHGFCSIPYEGHEYDSLYPDLNTIFKKGSKLYSTENIPEPNPLEWTERDEDSLIRNFPSHTSFLEEFELGLDDEENYSKVTIPSFVDGRNGRFLHDFKFNQTAIVDQDTKRCFVMPLDRNLILPPKSMFDLLEKMYSNYYKIDTETIREKWQVSSAPLNDRHLISPRINVECEDSKMYMLEKYENQHGGMVKRSVDISKTGKFAEYSGKYILEYDIVNIEQLDNN